MKTVERLRNLIRSLKAGPTTELVELAIPHRIGVKLCEELKVPLAEPLMFERIRLRLMLPREEYIHAGAAYAARRWNLMLTYDDVDSLMKAVPDDEMIALIPLIMNQHFDDKGYDDPLDKLTEEGRQEMIDDLEEIGIVDPSL